MRPLAKIISFTRELMPYYVAIVLAAVTTALLSLATPFIIGRATDVVVDAVKGIVPGAVSSVLWLAAAFLAVELASTIISSAGGYAGDIMAARMREILSNRYFAKLLDLPQRYFDNELTGRIVSRLNRSITEVTGFANAFSNNFFTMLIQTVAILAIAAFYAWPLALLLAIVFPIYLWLTALTSRRWQRIEGAKNKEIDAAGGRFTEVIAQIKVVKSFVQERRELAIFRRHFDTTVGLTKQQSRYWHTMDALRRGVMALVFFGIFAIIFVYTVRGRFSVGDMVLLIQLVTMARAPVTSMSYIVDTAQHAIAGSKDYFRVMELDLADDVALRGDAPKPRELEPVPGKPALQFFNVRFGYDDDADVLSGISFRVDYGEKVAFVGESGGGKTTLINLLLGLYPVRAGRIEVMGHDIAGLTSAELRRLIGVVFQEPHLFSGTIAENIGYADPDAPREVIEAAARRANADAFIAKFARGYDSLIGERGLKLSGGQKQRISVARAIVKDPRILVLDEATSALDTRSERLVQAGLSALMADRTSLIIAHRLSTISTVDRIITLRGGRIGEIGSPADLAASGGIYAELLALQNEGTKAAKKRLRGYGIEH
ncbi:iron ABC transporter ATP-binding protein [Bowdeniella nasicola]|uniref:Iron ABC transporter ATP-binding protein n=1 Tax=Bowdeniella nasicola TaxID=208480 RepID=A0A1Q5Q096_9ACTO|nr:ABC transporter ATP-binding protein [Bowdeniella nasicola]OKL53135.1 iron ABC transporter ATP-binding protein [Bowdeniella nasicola]